jgi:hypothetical protein
LAQRRLIGDAAMWLRGAAIADGYAGLGRKEIAFSVAAVLDMIALHWTELPERVRSEVLSSARKILSGRHGVGLQQPSPD